MGEGRLVEQIGNVEQRKLLEANLRNNIFGFLVHHDLEYWPAGLSKINQRSRQGTDLWTYRSVEAAALLLAAAGKRDVTADEVSELIHGYYIDEAEEYLFGSREMGQQDPWLPYLPFTAAKITAAVEDYRARGIELPINIIAE